jgi:hypothetical protein
MSPDEAEKKALSEFVKDCPIHNTLIYKTDIGLEII